MRSLEFRDLFADSLSNPKRSVESVGKVENVSLESLVGDVVPMESDELKGDDEEERKVRNTSRRKVVRRGQTHVGVVLRADGLEVDEPLLSRGSSIGRSGSELEKERVYRSRKRRQSGPQRNDEGEEIAHLNSRDLVSKLLELLSPKLASRRSGHVGLSTTVGPAEEGKEREGRSVSVPRRP